MISVLKLIRLCRETQDFLTHTVYYLELMKEKKITLLDPYSCLQQDDEELCLVWTYKRVKLDIGFSGDGIYSFWGKDLITEDEFLGDDIPIHHLLPQELLDLLIDETL